MMQLSPQELYDFRHRVYCELNQMLGYAELLGYAADNSTQNAAEIAATPRVQERIAQLRVCIRRLHLSPERLFSAHLTEEGSLRVEAELSFGGLLDEIERGTASLLEELPPEFGSNLTQIQSAYFSLRATLFRPLSASRNRFIPKAARVSLEAAYRAGIPAQIFNGGHLLVVHADPEDCSLIERQVKEMGLAMLSIGLGPQALIELASQHYDCVLLDLKLGSLNGGMSGEALLKLIRANSNWVSVPVLMLSEMDELGEAARCIDIGADDYIIRPVDPLMLRAKLYATIQRKQLSEQCRLLGLDVEVKNQEMQRFVMVASHDLQAPLRSLLVNLLDLEAAVEEKRSAEQQSLVKDSQLRCERMTALVQDLLTYVQLGQATPFVESVELDWVMSEAMSNLREDLEESGAEVVVGRLPAVRADFKQMVYAMQNLVGNAIQYRSALAPRIEVNSVERSHGFLISVVDNGCGIPEDQQVRIFEPFYRLHGDDVPGTGIGLAIARRAIEQAGGQIWVNSAVGQGSRFSFTLPKAEALELAQKMS